MIIKWLYPGIGVKRWIILGVLGVLLVSAGIALTLGIEVLGFLERWIVQLMRSVFDVLPVGIGVVDIAGLISFGLGCLLIIIGFRQTVRSLIGVIDPTAPKKLADIVYKHHYLKRGPKVVVIGGGTGLSTLLRGLKKYTSNITAVVAVSDDGGSSGLIREEFGILPPGDIRNTLVALADVEPLMEKLFQYRFSNGASLSGHSFGNLFIAAMTDITGDFQEAVRASSRVLAINGQVLPSTLEDVKLCAEYEDDTVVCGESRIPIPGKAIKRVYLSPSKVKPTEEVCQAINDADIVVIGPGSLYTSVMPNLLIPDILEAIKSSDGIKVYVCNVMTQPGETDGYTVSDHIKAIVDHVGVVFKYVIINSDSASKTVKSKYEKEGAYLLEPQDEVVKEMGFVPIVRPLLSRTHLARHDSALLAEEIIRLYEERDRQ
jgi:uncharacterized cofD-like protein